MALSPAIAAIMASNATVGIPVEFILFAGILIGVAVFHRHTLPVAVIGLAAILAYKILVTGFKFGPGFAGLMGHMAHEWVILLNLFLLLIIFGLLSRHFEKTRIPAVLPRILPHDWKGAFWLLVAVFVLSSFLDNIAAALIGGAMAHTLFRAKVHIGYLAAIVAASNGGGSGSVIGDTTTTMMWIDGVSPKDVLHAYVGAGVALHPARNGPHLERREQVSPVAGSGTGHRGSAGGDRRSARGSSRSCCASTPASSVARIQEIEREVKHDVIAFTTAVAESMAAAGHAEASRWLHYGLTSNDVVDTAQALHDSRALPRSSSKGINSLSE